ncbi:MAG: hypothetical protein P4K83_06505 [Terracidiphilus sp.]|nr:hypothetical protein [Terracidiphilus sp.]
MNSDFSVHLSEEALNDILIGIGSEQSERHLAQCPECRARVEEFNSGIALLDATSMAWSRQRAAQMPDPPPHTGAGRFPLATMGWATAAVLLIAIVAPVWRHHLNQSKIGYATQPAIQTPEVTHAEDSEAQIAQDNALMRDVDAAINASEASPLGGYTRPERPYRREKARPE